MDDNTLRDRLRGTDEEAVLLVIAETGGEAARSVLVERAGGESDASQAVARLQDFELVEHERSWGAEAALTARGHRLAVQINEGRTSGKDRLNAVQHGLLGWLATDAEPHRVTDFVGHTTASSWGAAFTDSEVTNAAEFLHTYGLIDGRMPRRRASEATASNDLMSPRITAEGRQALVSGESIPDYVRGGRPSADVTNTANFHGGNVGGVQVGGQGNAMHVVQNVSHEERTQILAGVAEVRRTLNDAGVVSDDLDSALDAVHEEAAKPDASRPALRERITEAVAVAAATQGATVALQGIATLLNFLTT